MLVRWRFARPGVIVVNEELGTLIGQQNLLVCFSSIVGLKYHSVHIQAEITTMARALVVVVPYKLLFFLLAIRIFESFTMQVPRRSIVVRARNELWFLPMGRLLKPTLQYPIHID